MNTNEFGHLVCQAPISVCVGQMAVRLDPRCRTDTSQDIMDVFFFFGFEASAGGRVGLMELWV